MKQKTRACHFTFTYQISLKNIENSKSYWDFKFWSKPVKKRAFSHFYYFFRFLRNKFKEVLSKSILIPKPFSLNLLEIKNRYFHAILFYGCIQDAPKIWKFRCFNHKPPKLSFFEGTLSMALNSNCMEISHLNYKKPQMKCFC